ncbi:MAG: DUF2721 domain-containing protein [Bacteroidota bacterium]
MDILDEIKEDIKIVAILYPAISLVMLAYTNRFLEISKVVRILHDKYSAIDASITDTVTNVKKTDYQDKLANLVELKNKNAKQISKLLNRVAVIRAMQLLGILSIVFCTVSVVTLINGSEKWGIRFFQYSAISLGLSLLLTVYEIFNSSNALDVETKDVKQYLKTIKEKRQSCLSKLSRFPFKT